MTARHVIKGTVGRSDLGAKNDPADVRRVQELLVRAAAVCKDPSLDPKSTSGTVKADTVTAMIAFQKKRKRIERAGGEGLYYPNGKSIAKLLGIERTGSPNIGDGPYFPFSSSWTFLDWRGNLNQKNYAHSRGPSRAHAACDLEAQQGRAIYAIKAGVVLDIYEFYWKTWAMEVDHGDFIVRYGEIAQTPELENLLTGKRLGRQSPVLAGQKIARVGNLIKPDGKEHDYDMLHLEMYDKTATGELTQKLAASSKKLKRINDGKVCPTYRRMDLVNPSARLIEWNQNRPIPY
jgi:murein DD-endopeptidase MepM/ murein hydrolase activator NlpD